MGLEKMSFITVELRGIGELSPILGQMRVFKIGHPF